MQLECCNYVESTVNFGKYDAKNMQLCQFVFFQVVNHKRNRTKPVKGQRVGENYICAFSGEKIILPISDPSKRFLLYIAVVTISKGTDDQGKTFKDISLMGIGFSQAFEVNVCKVGLLVSGILAHSGYRRDYWKCIPLSAEGAVPSAACTSLCSSLFLLLLGVHAL